MSAAILVHSFEAHELASTIGLCSVQLAFSAYPAGLISSPADCWIIVVHKTGHGLKNIFLIINSFVSKSHNGQSTRGCRAKIGG